MSDQMTRLLNQVAMARQINGMAQRHGYVHEVKESGGERKIRLVLGFNKQGEPWLSPWLHTEEHRGGSSSQQLVEKGQAMVMTCHAGSYRNATCSPSGESQSNPQPPHAPQFNGDTSSNGSKVRTATNKGGGSGSGASTSLLGSAEVLTPDGFKNIKDIKLGDKVIACNTYADHPKPIEDTVVGLHAALTTKQIYDLNYEGGRVCCTLDHEIWVEPGRRYTAADRLAFVDKVRGYDGVVGISSLVPREIAEHQVYDLTIATNANFFVRDGSTGAAILVHNANGGGGGGSDTHSVWIDSQKEQRQQHQPQTGQYEQSGGGDGFGGGSLSSSQQGGQQQSSGKPDPLVISHHNDDGSWTARHKDECRVMTAPKGSKMKTKQAHAFVTKTGIHGVKKPWVIMPKDPIPDNDSV
jgi:hypothetical protein